MRTYDEKCTICSTELDLPRYNEKQLREEQIKDETLLTIIKSLEEEKESTNYIEYIKKGYLLNKGVLVPLHTRSRKRKCKVSSSTS